MRKYLLFIALVILCSSCNKLNIPWSDTADSIPPSSFPASIICGVNWADPADNFKDNNIILTGLSVKDNYTLTASISNNILNSFQQRGANTVRLPINPPTVLGSWWDSYSAVIDKAIEKNMKVILCYWESRSLKDGRVDNLDEFWQMWQKVVTKYHDANNIYFEIFNEPYGYTLTDLTSLYSQWLLKYSYVPKNRVLLDGSGIALNVNSVGADARLSDCLLSYHNYTFLSGNTTVADWESAILSLKYPDRTIITEFGIPMIESKNYLIAPNSDREVAYLQGITNLLRSKKMGSVYWPGLRGGDWYSLLTLNRNSMSVNNNSGLKRLQYGWGIDSIKPLYGSFDSTVSYKIVNRNSKKSLDVKGSSILDEATIIQSDFLSSDQQMWVLKSIGQGFFSIINSGSNKVLDVKGSGAAALIVQNLENGSISQQWQIIDVGFGYFKVINRNSNYCLDINGNSFNNGVEAIQWEYHGGFNQQWEIKKL